MASSVIVKDREILGGVLVFAGARLPFQVLPDYIEAGQTLDELLSDGGPRISYCAVEEARALVLARLK